MFFNFDSKYFFPRHNSCSSVFSDLIFYFDCALNVLINNNRLTSR